MATANAVRETALNISPNSRHMSDHDGANERSCSDDYQRLHSGNGGIPMTGRMAHDRRI